MPQLSFYVLTGKKPLLDFVCQLTQKALNQSDEGVLIVAPNNAENSLMVKLDEQLWAFSDTAFIPHQCITATDPQQAGFLGVGLTDNLAIAEAFDGVIINLIPQALVNTLANRVLEVIDSDEASIVQGREKYAQYRQYFPNLEIKTHKI
ncbi:MULTISPECIES: DNA polymerase III subunit chi [unclassified Moraxella]|uniref:DNA polymerase III subunit chi n=1 Tax=unclassified Moraxella TaxID=2685852 RepID=UPI003AF7CFAB